MVTLFAAYGYDPLVLLCATLLQAYFDEHIDEERYCGYLHGFGIAPYNGNGYSLPANNASLPLEDLK